MKSYFLILTIAILGNMHVTWAQTSVLNLPPCVAVNHSQPVKVGIRCVTEENFVFERVDQAGLGEAWKDQAGLIWSDLLGFGNHRLATEKCHELGAALPSRYDFLLARRHEFDQALPNSVEVYWTSEIHPSTTQNYVYFYSPEVDYERWGFVSNKRQDDMNVGIRCVFRWAGN